MYTKFLSSNLEEYNKIIASINSSQNLNHYEVCSNMCAQFGRNCDHRLKMLSKNRYTLKGRKEYKKYKESTTMQVESVLKKLKHFYDSYNEWMEENQTELEKNKLEKKPKKTITGFSKLFKKNKK